MKRFTSVMLLMSLMFTLFAGVGQAATVVKVPRLFLEGVELKALTDPKIVNDRTLVPVRVLAEGLGYGISWDGATETVTVESSNAVIKLNINNKIALVGDQFVEMDTMAILENGTTLVPIRFIGETFGLSFEWNAEAYEVHMFKEQTEEPAAEPEEGTEKNADDELIDGEGQETAESSATILSIAYNGSNEVLLYYEGTLTTDRIFTLPNPERLVFDFKNTTYTNALAELFVMGELKTAIEGHHLLEGFRYSLFQHSPAIARLVFDVKEKPAYKLETGEGMAKLTLLTAEEAAVVEGAIIPGGLNENGDAAPSKLDKVYNIVIDAGHGGTDPGAPSVGGTREKVFNLNVALKVKALMDNEKQLKAHLTRSNDTFISLNDRVAFAENLKADLFVSIHANSLDRDTISGTETYYYRDNSKAFAEIMHKFMLEATGLPDRFVKKNNFRVITDTTMPAILLEAGYLSNKTDSSKLLKEETQDKIAAAIVAAIKSYLKIS